MSSDTRNNNNFAHVRARNEMTQYPPLNSHNIFLKNL